MADYLENAQLLLARAAVGGGDLDGERVGRLAQVLRQGAADQVERRLKAVLARQQLGAAARRLRQKLRIVLAEHRQVLDDLADGGKLGIGHVAVHGRYHDHGVNQGCVLADRSEEHTSELQSLMRISYAVFCLKTTT